MKNELEREGFHACYIAQNTDEVHLHLSFRVGDEIRVIQEGDTIVVYSRSTPPKTKPSIDWSHVAPKFKWLAVDGSCYGNRREGHLFMYKPQLIENSKSHVWWNRDSTKSGQYCRAESFASYEAGDCDWQDSLVQRPEGG